MKKPKWVIEKERARKAERAETLWLFGLHAVRAALLNPAREKLRLVATPNALERLGVEALAAGGLEPEIADPRRFPVPLDAGSVHQGVALEVRPLDWGSLAEVCAPSRRRKGEGAPRLVLLDRVSDPHNAGAVLRSAAVFGARAVIAPRRHAAPESGALAKAASGALELQPYLRVPNLARAMEELGRMGYRLVGLDGAAEEDLEDVLASLRGEPLGLVLGAEGPGMRALTRARCDRLARIPAAGGFASLNVSNAAAVALYAAARSPG
ncbi:MAG: RNA methyltransferase [Alphaproteobacteria bacterium]|nr:MAG: RNA methyltransferase [Alphaproteobacteria bacterium]